MGSEPSVAWVHLGEHKEVCASLYIWKVRVEVEGKSELDVTSLKG